MAGTDSSPPIGDIEYYNLDAIFAVGYRIRSPRGTQFRNWATERLHEYLVKGFAMDDDRLLAAILFSDIAASTARAAEPGEHRRRELLDNPPRPSCDNGSSAWEMLLQPCTQRTATEGGKKGLPRNCRCISAPAAP